MAFCFSAGQQIQRVCAEMRNGFSLATPKMRISSFFARKEKKKERKRKGKGKKRKKKTRVRVCAAVADMAERTFHSFPHFLVIRGNESDVKMNNRNNEMDCVSGNKKEELFSYSRERRRALM